jgi:cytochrome c-type biogenesis protein CcmH/NrfF
MRARRVAGLLSAAAVAFALTVALVTAGPAGAATPRTSLTDIEYEVMCVTCNVPLNVAESPQATQQRDFIRTLIAQGLTKQQIKDRLVDQYGPNVLALPQDKGFGLAAYLVPIGVAVGLIAILVLLLPRWRRRTAGGAGAPAAAGPSLSAADEQRLDDDLARYDL